MYAVYILFSEEFNKIYIGYTSDLIQRFYSHNALGQKGWTIRYRPWKVIHVEIYEELIQAVRREKFLKSGQGRRFIKDELKKF